MGSPIDRRAGMRPDVVSAALGGWKRIVWIVPLDATLEPAGPGSRTATRAPHLTKIKPWTIAALHRLKRYAEEGVGIAQIQRQYFPDRTYSAVYAQIRKLGLAGEAGCVRYREEELELIRTLVEKNGLTATQISATGLLPGRSADSIQVQIGRLGLVDAERSDAIRHARPWTQHEQALLEHLVSDCHLGANEIVRDNHLPGRTSAAIHERINRLHLADPRRSETARRARNRTLTGEVRRYREFLELHAIDMDVAQIAEHWKRSPRTVRRDLRKLGIAVPHCGLPPASRERIRSSAQTSQRKRWAEWKERKRQLLFKRREEMRAEGVQIEERTCRKCGQKWYLTREFFREKYNLRNGTKREFFAGSCILCRP
jgi:hypothetical protein